MIPIVIPLHHAGGKFKDNTELRYALRSIATHFKGDHQLAIVGRALPDWVRKIEHITCQGGLKSAIIAAADRFPDGFIWYYDDCCILRDTTGEEMKITPAVAHYGRAQTKWGNSLNQVKERLEKEGIQPVDYSRPHGPYWFDRSMIDEAFEDWPGMAGKFPFESWILSKRNWPHRFKAVRQYYGPFKSPPDEHAAFLNFADNGASKELFAWLGERFPKLSPYEAEPPAIEAPTMSKNAISFSLYGEDPKYAVGMLENLPLCQKYYNGWQVIVHVERGHYAIDRLKSAGAEVVEHAPEPGHGGMMWRYLTADLPQYERVIFRDADSRVNPREKAATEAWITSGKALHVMRDHPQHRKPIMGGMFGIKTGLVNFAATVAKHRGTGRYADDEAMLATRVFPQFREDAMIHAVVRGNGELPFPETSYPGFVGERIPPRLDGLRFVFLSPEHYSHRRQRFMDRLSARGGVVQGAMPDWWKATPPANYYTPPGFRQKMRRAHWWAATCDHLRIIEEALMDETVKFLLVVEDDVIFAPDFDHHFWRAFAAAPPGWKSIRFGWNKAKHHPTPINPAIHRSPRDGAGMYAHLWNRAGMVRFYDHLWHRRHFGIDGGMVDLRQMEPKDWYQTPHQCISLDPASAQRGRDS